MTLLYIIYMEASMQTSAFCQVCGELTNVEHDELDEKHIKDNVYCSDCVNKALDEAADRAKAHRAKVMAKSDKSKLN